MEEQTPKMRQVSGLRDIKFEKTADANLKLLKLKNEAGETFFCTLDPARLAAIIFRSLSESANWSEAHRYETVLAVDLSNASAQVQLEALPGRTAKEASLRIWAGPTSAAFHVSLAQVLELGQQLMEAVERDPDGRAH
jgi:hypothetical protein